ncbi:hypothetical protein V8G54_036264 [Vigna mungo]|uniref:Transposase-associated domain-containing protein n=1 Tax=Vigna mungo TaxID=3915 RepID=A0AAQ3MGQ4_VIGMU
MAAYEDNCPVPLSNYSDKSWIAKPQNTIEYSIGLEKFLNFAFENGAIGDTIRCPCPKYGFMKWHNRVEVEEHLILKQFPKNYVIWNLHGEKQTKDIPKNEDDIQETFHSENPMETMINEAFGHYRQECTNIGSSQPVGVNNVLNERPRENHNEFNEFLNDGNQILYDGRKNLRQADLPYYGKLEDIIELNYYGRFKVVLFKCNWASQAQMVYYVNDVVNKGWSVVMHLKPRDLYEMGEEVEEEVYENEPYEDQQLEKFYSNDNEYVQLATNHLDDDIHE